ncbi:MAG: glycosyltransferase family 4 protein [Cyanobacteria bacterium J06648_16]
MTTQLYSSLTAPSVNWRLLKSASQPTRVGILSPGYNMARVSYIIPSESHQYTTLKRVPFHRLERRGSFLDNTALFLNPSVDLVHTFNMLPVNGPRFVTSFELEMPRYLESARLWQYRFGNRLMASDRCRGLLALSQIAGKLLKQQFCSLGMEEVARKIRVFRGAVLPSSSPEYEKTVPSSGPIKLLFVGGQAFRKGLIPTFKAVERLRHGGIEVELTVVSTLAPDEYVTTSYLESTIEDWRRTLTETDWVTYHPALPNLVVRQLMRQHALLVFPSYDESLGWTVVEAGMEGTATIGTRMFAFPEMIDDGKTGRLIPLPLSEQSRWRGLDLDEDSREQARLADDLLIEQGLVEAIEKVALDRTLIHQWGQAAYRKMRSTYSPTVASQALSSIYAEALKDT